MQLSGLNVPAADMSLYQTAMGSLREAITESRELMAFLESLPESPEFSLDAGISRLVQRLSPLAEQAGQSICTRRMLNPMPRLPIPTSWAVYRIVQQALQNAIQHAGPTEIQLIARQSEEQLMIEVIDQGCGFDTATIPAVGHYGLTSMRERAATMGARLEIESSRGNGTIVRLALPHSLESKR